MINMSARCHFIVSTRVYIVFSSVCANVCVRVHVCVYMSTTSILVVFSYLYVGLWSDSSEHRNHSSCKTYKRLACKPYCTTTLTSCVHLNVCARKRTHIRVVQTEYRDT